MLQKKILRQEMLKRRKQILSIDRNGKNLTIAEVNGMWNKLFQLIEKSNWQGKTISFFYPIGSEIHVLRLYDKLLEFFPDPDITAALPVVTAPNQPLVFRQYQAGDQLVAENFGTYAPEAGKPIVFPEIMFVPLLAFDRKKFRLGYGGGFYDRSIAELCQYWQGQIPNSMFGKFIKKMPLTIGIAWSGQEVLTIPTEANDLPMDIIVTEQEVFI